MKWWTAVLPVLTLIVGYLGTLVTEAAQGNRARRIAKEQRDEALSATRQAERRKFELETLSELAEAISDLARAAGRANHFDFMQARENNSSVMPTTQLPGDINDALFESNRRVNRLVGLVMDEEARAKVREFTAAVARMGITQVPVDDSIIRLVPLMEAADEAQRLVAERIRGIYEGTVTTS